MQRRAAKIGPNAGTPTPSVQPAPEITASLASGGCPQDEDAATDVPETTSTSSAHLGFRRSQTKAVFFSLHSIGIAILSVYNAFASEISAPVLEVRSTMVVIVTSPKHAVFAASAWMEAIGLASGVGFSIYTYFRGDDRSLWRDMLCEPCFAVIEAILGEAGASRTLYYVGMFGITSQFLVVLVVYSVDMPFQHLVHATSLFLWLAIFLFSVVGVSLKMGFRAARILGMKMYLPLVLTFAVALPLMNEGLEAYFLILSDASVPNVALVVLDFLAFAPLAVLPLAFIVPSVLYFLLDGIYFVARHSCPSVCEDFIGSQNQNAYEDYVMRVYGRYITPETAETGQQSASPDANVQRTSAV